ncbi:MAG: aminoacyl-tRNA hydrolase [Clostridiales bacterium]|nr:aminoacyl-tRNA hydrolase [Clostridiales bacterium]
MFGIRKKQFNDNNKPEFLIVGLGNPGKKYEFTRHNSGFLFIDVFAEYVNAKIKKIGFKSVYGEAKVNGHRCLIMKPQTYMNNSGEAVKEAVTRYGIPPQNVIVIFDDVSLPCGKLRIRRKGSSGGHNGIKSITAHLKDEEFPRIKLGVGEKPHPDADLADWVLSPFSKQELIQLRGAVDEACKAAELIVGGEIDKAMGLYN